MGPTNKGDQFPDLVALVVFHADGDQRRRLRSPVPCVSCLQPVFWKLRPDWSA